MTYIEQAFEELRKADQSAQHLEAAQYFLQRALVYAVLAVAVAIPEPSE